MSTWDLTIRAEGTADLFNGRMGVSRDESAASQMRTSSVSVNTCWAMAPAPDPAFPLHYTWAIMTLAVSRSFEQERSPSAWALHSCSSSFAT
jgi:hypothetical protein